MKNKIKIQILRMWCKLVTFCEFLEKHQVSGKIIIAILRLIILLLSIVKIVVSFIFDK